MPPASACTSVYELVGTPDQESYIHLPNLSQRITFRTPFIFKCMYTDKMFPFSIRDRVAPFENQPTKNAGLILESLRNQNMLFAKKIPSAPSFELNAAGSELTVSTDHFPARNNLQFHSCGCSPPPPALSPASLSPAHVGGSLPNQTSSPSPPVIVAEISTHSSSSSGTMSERTAHFIPSSNFSRSATVKSAPSENALKFNDKLTAAPRLTPLSSSSSSSSSSTSTSSVLADSVEQGTQGLPILEKISIALGSPRRSLGDPLPAIQSKDSSVWDNNNFTATWSQHFIPTAPAVDKCAKPEASISVQPDDCPIEIGPFSCTKEELKSVREPVDPPRRSRSGRSKKMRFSAIASGVGKSKRGRWDSHSDSDFKVVCSSRPSRGRGGLLTVAAQRRKAENRLIPNDSMRPSITAESLANRRYLESPFLCLCQSGTMASSLTDVAERLRINPNQSSETAPSDVVNLTTSLSAHVISPALRGLSNLGCIADQSTPLSIPPTCPSNLVPAGEHEPRNDFSDHAETRTIFSGLMYRPSNLLKTRTCSTNSAASVDRSWLCAFCGKDNTFLELGGLYGPYCLTDSERSQLPSAVIAPRQLSDSNPSSEADKRSSDVQITKQNRPGVTTSTVTRSAAAQGKNTVSNTGTLRLIIKSRDASRLSNSGSSTAQPLDELSRVGWDGEVWFHLECVLWAPGTYLIGNGIVAGLGDALQLALDSICSGCDKRGAILNCAYHGCGLRYHYLCAVGAGCLLNEEQYTLKCKKHRDNSRT